MKWIVSENKKSTRVEKDMTAMAIALTIFVLVLFSFLLVPKATLTLFNPDHSSAFILNCKYEQAVSRRE